MHWVVINMSQKPLLSGRAIVREGSWWGGQIASKASSTMEKHLLFLHRGKKVQNEQIIWTRQLINNICKFMEGN